MLGCCAHSNETSRSIFADCLWSCWILQKHCAACSLLLAVLLVRRTACSCVLCVVRVCVHSAALQHLQRCVLCIVPVCVHSAALQHLQSCVLCVLPISVHTVLPFSTYRAVCCVLYRFVFTQCCFTELCVVFCTGLCSHSAVLQHLQSCVFSVVPVCVHTVLPYSTYRAVCCVLYRFVFTQCYLTALTALTELHTATANRHRYKLWVISPYNCKCRPPHYKIFRVLCEVEHTHAQTDDGLCHFNRSFAHHPALKWRQVFCVCPCESLDTTLKEFWMLLAVCLWRHAVLFWLIL